MKRFSIFMWLLLMLAGGNRADAQVWVPTQRAATLEEGKQYMLYNTTYDHSAAAESDKDRTGFLFNSGSSLGHSGSPKKNPSTFSTSENKYLWTIETTGETYKYYMKSVSSNTYVGPAGVTTNAAGRDLYIQPWQDSQAPKGTVSSKNDDGTITATADINADTKVFTICGTGLTSNGKSGNQGDCWNGTANGWTTWGNSHPYAFYEVKMVRTADDVAAYNDAKEKLNNAAYTLQNAYGLATATDKYSTNAQQSSEGPIAGICDGNYSTYFHSRYSGNAVNDYHYLQVELAEAKKSIRFYFKKREGNNNNRPTEIVISGSNDGTDFTEVQTISSGLPTDANILDYYSDVITTETAYKYYRFTVKRTNSQDDTEGSSEPNNGKFNGYPYFTFSEFYVLPGDNSFVNELIEARNDINALSYLDENFNTTVNDCAGTFAKLENVTKTVTIKHVYDGYVFQQSETTNILGNTATYTSDVTRYGLVCDNPEQTFTIVDENNVVTFTYSLNEAEATPFKVTSSISGTFPEDTKWYKLTLRNKHCRYNPATNQVDNSGTAPATWLSKDLFAFTGDPARGYKIYNKYAGANKILGDETEGAVTTNTPIKMVEDTEGRKRYIFEHNFNSNNEGFDEFRKDSTELGYLNDNNNKIGYWVAGDAKANLGDHFTFTEVSPEELADILLNDVKTEYQVTYDYISNREIGNELGKYSAEGLDVTTLDNAKKNIVAAWSGTDAEAIRTAMETLTTLLDGKTIELNKPANGSLLRMTGATNNKPMTSNYTGNRIDMGEAGVNGDETVFYYTDGKLVAFKNGLCLGKFTNDQETWGVYLSTDDKASSDVQFLESGTIGKYNICPSADRFIYNGNTQVDCGSSDANENYRWTIEKVPFLPVKMGDYATLYSPVPLGRWYAGTERVKAYTGKLESDRLVLTEIEDNTIPANTPVILEYKNGRQDNDCVYLEVVADKAFEGENDFSGIFFTTPKENVNVTGTICTMQMYNNVLGFYRFNGDNLGGFKAYLDVPAEYTQSGFRIVIGGEETGIENVAAGKNDKEVYYDLNGRPVLYPTHGIYVTGSGKKVFFK